MVDLPMTPEVTYFSDVLCVWAYVGQERLEAVRRTFPNLTIRHRFISVFGDVPGKIAGAWKDRGGFSGYARHVRGVAGRFPHVTVGAEAWEAVRPASSASPHLVLSALRQWEAETSPGSDGLKFEAALWAFRRAFFADGKDIADQRIQQSLIETFDVDYAAVLEHVKDGSAFAALCRDYQDAERMKIEGSPTFVLNDGRQKLYGNVGFRIVEANIAEMLRQPDPEQASWC